jgi:glutathione S-transferase
LKPILYSAQRCPYARRTRIVLREKRMAFANEYFFPAIYGACMGYEREFSEEQVQEALEKLRKALLRLEHQLENRQYLVGEYTLADIAHAGTFPGLKEVANRWDAPLKQYPNVRAWVEQVKSRESYKVSV